MVNIERGKEESLSDFIFLGCKITADFYCCHEIKICLLLERKAMPHLTSMLKIKDISFQANVSFVKAMIFPVVMYGLEGWTRNKTVAV